MIKVVRSNWILIVILLIASALRLYKPDFQSLWGDEALTMKNADPDLSLRQFYRGVMSWEYIPHLYFYLNRVVFQIFGYTTLVARIFSGVIGILGVYSVYLLGKTMLNKRAGLLAAAFLAVNMFHISYSQEIRPYGMLFLFSVLSFYRLILFLRDNSSKNAIYYGIFTGLIVHSHFFGLITIFGQAVLFLFFLILRKDDRIFFFRRLLIAAAAFVIVILPVIHPLIRMSKISSFWLTKPGEYAFTSMFKDFMGGSEAVVFIAQLAILFYIIRVFRQKVSITYQDIIQDKVILGGLILFSWLFFSVSLPLIRSHIGIPMIINRYFINLLPVLILAIAMGTSFIRNKIAISIVVISFVSFSLIEMLAVKKYYSTVTKTQLRELTAVLKKMNPENDRIVTFYSWIFPYYFRGTDADITGNTFEDYIKELKSGKAKMTSFWYMDCNSRPYSLNPEDEAFLAKHFTVKQNIKVYDAWASHYVLNSELAGNINLKMDKFSPLMLDGQGNLMMFENGEVQSPAVTLKEGKYQLKVNGNSLPEQPINGENAHIVIMLAGKKIADFSLSEKKENAQNTFPFEVEAQGKYSFGFIFDNDISLNGQDRNVIIRSIQIVKEK